MLRIHIVLLSIIRKTLKGRKQTNKNGRGTERHLPKTDESSSGPRVSVTKTYSLEMKRNENEYFGQITVAFLSSRIQETEAKFLSAAEARVECGGLTDIETGVVSGLEDKLVCSFKLAADVVWGGVR